MELSTTEIIDRLRAAAKTLAPNNKAKEIITLLTKDLRQSCITLENRLAAKEHDITVKDGVIKSLTERHNALSADYQRTQEALREKEAIITGLENGPPIEVMIGLPSEQPRIDLIGLIKALRQATVGGMGLFEAKKTAEALRDDKSKRLALEVHSKRVEVLRTAGYAVTPL